MVWWQLNSTFWYQYEWLWPLLKVTRKLELCSYFVKWHWVAQTFKLVDHVREEGGGGFQKRPVSVVIMDYFSNCSSSCEKRQKYWLVFRHLCTHFFQTHFMDSYYYRTVLCHFEWSWPAFKITGYVQVKTLLMHSSGREIRTNKSCNSQANIDC